ncbi:MAG: hypothetical protein AAGJ11_14335, partial [Bacteroidota bacterium]
MSVLHDTLPEIQVAPQPLADLVAPLQPDVVGAVVGPADVLVEGVTMDSRRATSGSLFAAVTPDVLGARDGHEFVDDALARGAVAA